MSDKYMDYKKIKRILLVFMTLAVIGTSSCVFAEGYKYKITDPRYNTAVQFTSPQESYDRTNLQNNPVNRFRSVISVVINIVIALSKKIAELFKLIAGEAQKPKPQYYKEPVVHTSAVKKVKEDIKEEIQDTTTNSDSNEIDTQKAHSESPDLSKNVQKFAKASQSAPTNKKTSVEKSEFSINEYLSSPIQKPHNPILLSSSKLTRNKGLCLVQYKDKVSLIGYINKKVFVLAQFNSLSTNEIRSRLAENEGDNERYIVKLGNYKALLEVSENNMELLLEL